MLALELSTLKDTDYNISFINTSSFTLAGLSAIYFRHLFLTEDTIGLVPASGYKFDQQSIPGEIFFRYMNHKRKEHGQELIRYNRNSVHGELRVLNYKALTQYLKPLYNFFLINFRLMVKRRIRCMSIRLSLSFSNYVAEY